MWVESFALDHSSIPEIAKREQPAAATPSADDAAAAQQSQRWRQALPEGGDSGANGYPYPHRLKKVFPMTVIARRRGHKKLSYTNPYAKRTAFSVHSSNPNAVEVMTPQLTVGVGSTGFIRITIHPASAGVAQVFLYIHNDDADRNEESLRFDLTVIAA